MLVHLLVILFFVAVGAIPNGRIDVVYPSMETLRSGMKRLRLRALGQDIELRLEPAGDVIADDFTIIHGENGEKDHTFNVQNLKRKLYRAAEMGSALHIDEDGPLTINGILNSELRIEPDTLEKRNENGIIAHRVIEVLKDENLRYDIGTIPPGAIRSVNFTGGMQSDECIQIEYLFVAETSFAEMFKKNSGESMEVYLANLMNAVKILFDSLDLRIKVVIIGIIKHTKANEAKLGPYIPSQPRGIAAEETLINMAKFYCKSTDILVLRADIVMLITKRPLGDYDKNKKFSDNTAGIAFPNTVCRQCYKYGLVTDDSKLNERADTVAHESAHLLGCDHDGEGDELTGSKNCPASDGYIMGDRNKKNGMKFSACCKRSVRKQLQIAESRCIIEDCDDI